MFPFLIAHVLFWAFLLIGTRDIGWRGCAIYVGLWLAGYAASIWLPSVGAAFVSYVAILDIALVFHVFGGDVHLR